MVNNTISIIINTNNIIDHMLILMDCCRISCYGPYTDQYEQIF